MTDTLREWIVTLKVTRSITAYVEAVSHDDAVREVNKMHWHDEENGETTDFYIMTLKENA